MTMLTKFSICAAAILVFATACKKEKEEAPQPAPAPVISDASIYEAIKSSTNYMYYKSDTAIKASSVQTAHGPWFRVRFNAIAAAALTDNGKLPVGTSFPEGAIVVKELYETQAGGLKYLAVMQKSKSHANRNADWLWLEYDAASNVVNGLSNSGNACVGCHSTNDRDKVRLFELFP